MIERKQYSNNFKFRLCQDNEVVSEKMFSADIYNPVTRYSVDIRSLIPSIIQNIQKTLSKRNLTHQEIGYDLLLEYKKNSQNTYNINGFKNKLSKPKTITHNYQNKKTLKGVEFKFGLYINTNPIVERKFFVDNYNPSSRFSSDLIEIINEICGDINNNLKSNDINHMWDDYVLIKKYGMHISKIRELSKIKRIELLGLKNERY